MLVVIVLIILLLFVFCFQPFYTQEHLVQLADGDKLTGQLSIKSKLIVYNAFQDVGYSCMGDNGNFIPFKNDDMSQCTNLEFQLQTYDDQHGGVYIKHPKLGYLLAPGNKEYSPSHTYKGTCQIKGAGGLCGGVNQIGHQGDTVGGNLYGQVNYNGVHATSWSQGNVKQDQITKFSFTQVDPKFGFFKILNSGTGDALTVMSPAFRPQKGPTFDTTQWVIDAQGASLASMTPTSTSPPSTNQKFFAFINGFKPDNQYYKLFKTMQNKA